MAFPFAAVASIAAPIIGGLFSSSGQKSANEASAASVERQLAFQRESVQNSYQWAVADMKKAGINPMLAYQRGGASALSGSSYTAQNELAGLGAGIQEGGSSALAVRRQNADLDQIRANVKSIHQNVKTSRANESNIQTDTRLKRAQTNYNDMLGANQRLEYKRRELDMNSARTAATIAKQDDKFYKTKYGQFLRWLDRTGTSINPLRSATR